MVVMPTTSIVQFGCLCPWHQRHERCIRLPCHGLIQVVDVGLMVEIMMELHGGCINVRLKRILGKEGAALGDQLGNILRRNLRSGVMLKLYLHSHTVGVED